VSFEEFCTIVRKKISDDEEEREMRDMFRILDKEKRGEVNTDELRSDSFFLPHDAMYRAVRPSIFPSITIIQYCFSTARI